MCASKVAVKKKNVDDSEHDQFTKRFARGGLPYLGDKLAALVTALEGACFLSLLRNCKLFLTNIILNQVGGDKRSKELTAKLRIFFAHPPALLHCHFNKDGFVQRQKQKHPRVAEVAVA